MKKYLMIGFAAVAFASCSNHDIETMSQEQIIKAQYEANFVAQFGQPASNQDWGFGSSTRAFTRTYNVEGNLWHDPAYYNLEYDAPVTTAEKNLVFNYVNNKNNVRTVDQISFKQYWVAQIWNGKNDANADGVKAPTSTSYPDQNGAKTTTVGGEHMDKLDILEKADTWTHCNNFNAADNDNWIEPEKGGVEGRTLMWDSGTLSFRCINSDGSHMSEKYIIVPGENIDASLKGFYYVCFDFEKGYTAEEQANERSYGTCEVWKSQATQQDPDAGYWQGGENWDLPGFYKDANSEDLKSTLETLKGTKVQNITFKGYLYGQQHYAGDDNYTDWIVRISPAKVKGFNYTGRIMAEDLSAQYDPTGKTSDWDFNDVVFDWAIKDGKAYIKLLAAGGTLPIRIGGTRNDNSSEPAGSVEIHDNVNGLGGYMKNCGVGNEVPAKELVLDDHEYTDAQSILITVYKGGSWVEIEANQGEPAAKFNCPVNTDWCDEYVNINRVYENFSAWVANPGVNPWAKKNPLLTDKDLTNND